MNPLIKTSIVSLAVWMPFCLTNSWTRAQGITEKPELKGQLLQIGEGEQDKQPLKNVLVTVKEYGNSTLTNDDGIFRLSLPPNVEAGQEIVLTQNKPGYAIHVPLFGKQRLPNRWSDMVEVRVLPTSSKLFWTHSRIEEFIKFTANESAKRVEPSEAARHQLLASFIEKLATEYGFTDKEVKEQILDWIVAAKKDRDNPHRQGLLKFAEENFAEAAIDFRKAARRNDEEASRNYELAGDSSSNAMKFQSAIIDYKIAIDRLPDTASAQHRKSLEHKIAVTYVDIGIHGDSFEAKVNLEQAVSILEKLLKNTDRPSDKIKWANLHNGLGLAKSELGLIGTRETSINHQRDAIKHHRLALSVYTKDQTPFDWAMIQHNLALDLFRLALSVEKDKAPKLLDQAIAAYDSALLECTKEQFPQDWAMIQNNRGNSLSRLGQFNDSEEPLKLAVDAYELALSIRNMETLPLDWAMTQNNLGLALTRLARRVKDVESIKLLDRADDAFQKAITVYTKDRSPPNWGKTQSNRADALMDRAIRTKGDRRQIALADAKRFYQDAFSVFTANSAPEFQRQILINLARSLLEIDVDFNDRNHVNELTAFTELLVQQSNKNQQVDALAAYIFNEKLFHFDKAYDLGKDLEVRDPHDLITASNFAWNHFTTGRFDDCLARTRKLCDDPKLKNTPNLFAAMKTLEVSCYVVLDKPDKTREALAELTDLVSSQAPEFQLSPWSFAGTRYFVENGAQPAIVASRNRLGKLFDAVTATNRDGILNALRELKHLDD